jgi:zinc D-Ala-D-Ala carboxypeptidase
MARASRKALLTRTEGERPHSQWRRQPAREVLADSLTLKGGAAAGVATIGAAGVEVAREALAATQGAILPLVPHLDTMRWVFIAIALAGIATAIYARVDDGKRGRR